MTVAEGDAAAPKVSAADAPTHHRPAWAVVGALVSVVIGLAMLVPAVHIATEPILLPTAAGPAFDCGTALQPPTKAFPVKVCGAVPRRSQQQAAAWGVAALIVAIGGALAFLVPTRTRTARHLRRRSKDVEDDAG